MDPKENTWPIVGQRNNDLHSLTALVPVNISLYILRVHVTDDNGSQESCDESSQQVEPVSCNCMQPRLSGLIALLGDPAQLQIAVSFT